MIDHDQSGVTRAPVNGLVWKVATAALAIIVALIALAWENQGSKVDRIRDHQEEIIDGLAEVEKNQATYERDIIYIKESFLRFEKKIDRIESKLESHP